MFNLQGFLVKRVPHRMTRVPIVMCVQYNGQWVDHIHEVYKYFRPVTVASFITDQCDNMSTWSATEFRNKTLFIGCPKSKCTDFLFKYLLDSPEITSYLLQNMTLGKLHCGSSVFSTDHSSTGNHFTCVCSSAVTIFCMFSIVQKWWPFNLDFNLTHCGPGI
jgi:hypothetical protein